ncbi:MAG TPA: hypothetical protein VGM17_02450 [Rhizomicrobium sp.]|jgi:hypothetical protein
MKTTGARALSDSQKTTILARAIAGAARARGSVTVRDGVQAGLSEREVSRLWDDATIEARRLEPRLPEMVLQP